MRSEGGSRFAERYAGVVLFLVIFAYFSITIPDKFLTRGNLVGILSNQSVSAIVALGLLMPLAAGVFDISIGGVMTLAVVASTWLFQTTSGSMPIWGSIVITLVFAACFGLVNAFLVIKVSVDPFIATIGTSTVLLGVSEALGNGTTISNGIPQGFVSLARTQIDGVPITVLYMLVLALALWYILDHTPLGRRIYATGAGREAARLSGVRVNRVLAGAFVTSATFAAAAGILYAAGVGSGPPEVGNGFLLPAYSVAFLGATIIKPGRFNVLGLIVAVFIIAVGINGLQLSGWAFWIVDVFQGGALLVAVVVAQLGKRRGKARSGK